MGARNREGIGLSYRPARTRICRPFKESKNRFSARRASTTTLFVVPARQATWAGEIDSSESIPGLHKHLQIRALATLSGGIDSRESILGLLKSLKIRAQDSYRARICAPFKEPGN